MPAHSPALARHQVKPSNSRVRANFHLVPIEMSLSPKHTTPFSVTDILSPIEEHYKRTTIEASIPPLLPYARTQQGPPSSTSAAMAHGMASMGASVPSPYHNYVPQLTHHTGSAFPSAYCNGTDMSPYADPMTMTSRHSSTGWYGTNPDPRLASKLLRLKGTQKFLQSI